MHLLNMPVLFLVFNRLDVTKQVFAQIAEAKPPRLYIACDGPRRNKDGEKQKVHELREYLLANIDWECQVQTLFREENLGCGRAVSEGISWFFQHEPMGIILEDDCLPSQSFFYFCQELLIKYQNDKRIWQIGGTSFIKADDLPDSSYYFSKITNIWGWASWSNRWQEYDFYMRDYPEFIRRKFLDGIFGNFIVKLWHKVLFNKNAGKTLNWDSQWYFTALINHGLCITPQVNLIKNIGFDLVDSTNNHGPDKLLSTIQANEIQQPLIHPTLFCTDSHLDDRYYKWRLGKFVILKIMFQPLLKVDAKLFDQKIFTLYKQITRFLKNR